MLDVRNLHVQFQTANRIAKAVDGLSFQVKRGQTLGIVGESGSGKSVTSLAVMGLIPAPGRVANGEIWFQPDPDKDAVNLRSLTPEQMQRYRGGQVSMIFQEPLSSLNPVYTCGFQLTEAIRQHNPNIAPAEARRRAIGLLQEVKLLPSDEELRQQAIENWQKENPGVNSSKNSTKNSTKGSLSDRDLDDLVNQQKHAMLERYPHQLSGGQIQRVMIAMAISCDPSLLIADEPTTALDVTVQARILDLLRELRDRRGMSIMFITHDLGLIADIADQVAVMYRGKIVEAGSVWDIFSNPQHPYTRGLLACRPQPTRRLRVLPTINDFMEVSTDANGETVIREKPMSLDQALRSNAAVSLEEDHQRTIALQEQPPILSVQNLQVGYPIRGMFGRAQRSAMAVNGVSFQVYPGETLGLVGESGCGKTTLARTLLHLVKPTSGKILFENRDITRLSGDKLRQLRREMQIIFQDPFSSLDPRITIGEAIMEPLMIHKVGNGRRDRLERMSYLLDRVGLNPEFSNRYPHEFSGGQRQRVCIARALALNPKFIICDESVSALDVSVQAQVLNLLKELQDEFKLTYIFISHDLSVVKFMSDRIMVMNRGKIEEIDTADSIYRRPQTEYTRHLIAAIPLGNLDTIRDRQAQRGLAVG
ncbi:ABC transporter ATP-binding protein [Leptolyngbya ohadii]|uniref:ABC transporter ATP-binding protein n=1 Tax=Leptolyngbya ohadii TaxID=1962290 RepID=UPI0034E2F650